VCANQTGVAYSIAAVNGSSTYNWVVPAGATITSGQNTPAIVVNYGLNGGNVKVRAGNSCGFSSYRSLATSIVCKETLNDLIELNVEVFPNPSNSEFTLQIDEGMYSDFELIIRDVAGRVVEKKNINGESEKFTFGLLLPGGFYTAEFIIENRKYVVRLIKN
jgi:hypothetical protein